MRWPPGSRQAPWPDGCADLRPGVPATWSSPRSPPFSRWGSSRHLPRPPAGGRWGPPAPPAGAAGGGTERPSQLEPQPLPAGVLPLGSVPSDQRVDFEVVLSPRDPAGLGALLSNLYDPSSPEYHQWLAPRAFDQEFGPRSEERR